MTQFENGQKVFCPRDNRFYTVMDQVETTVYVYELPSKTVHITKLRAA